MSTEEKRKANSYYYWHGHEKERAAVGDVAPLPTPVLVKREEVVADPALVHPRKTVAKYAWSDGNKWVTVYIDTWVSGQPGAADEALVNDSIAVDYAPQSVHVRYDSTMEGKKVLREFLVPILHQRIDPSKSSHRIKVIEKEGEPTRQQIIVKLTKEKEGSWLDLIGKTIYGETADAEEKEEDSD